ncbi:MAG: hypothetical protein LAO78_13830 [Acidobacteriia bacterium]|nr:hypothetical protein [Terriglobia bacterium]
MTNDCKDRKDSLLEAALTGETESSLQQHLASCEECRQELETLRVRRARMDAALLMVAQGGPQPDFHARVVQAAEAAGQKKFAVTGWFRMPRLITNQRWMFAASALALALAIVAGVVNLRPSHKLLPADIAGATQLANWQSPTAALMETPGKELLSGSPQMGESFMRMDLNIVDLKIMDLKIEEGHK